MRAGDRVVLRSPEEILATLDDRACLDGLPFMPEMLGFFGRAATVTARVERACDTVNYTGVLRLRDTVILEDLRCDGSGHAGCQAQCRLYWKEAWLRPASPSSSDVAPAKGDAFQALERLATENVNQAPTEAGEPTFRCQATELIRAGEPVGWFDFARELTSGNVGLWRFVRVTAGIAVQEIGRRLGLRSGEPFRPNALGGKNAVTPAPSGLRPGEVVRVRTRQEIGRTLGPTGKARGLHFDREMLPYCGQTARVKSKVERFIDEGNGRMVELASDCYILEDVVCKSYHSTGRWFCPRAIYPWWREAWLEQVEPEGGEQRPAADAG